MLVDPGAVHVCYCHNPFRYAWTEREATLRARHPLVRPALRVLLNRWRQWDWIAAQRVDSYVVNSRVTAERFRAQLKRIVAEAVRRERSPRPEDRSANRGLAGGPAPPRGAPCDCRPMTR